MNRLWECKYAHDRRKHRHRCIRCSRIINATDDVVMARIGKATKTVHVACADVDAGDGLTYRQLMTAWSAP